MTEILLACRDCSLIHRISGTLSTDRSLLCRRCGRRIWRSPRGGMEHALAFAATVMILLVVANAFALFEISLAGEHRSGFIMNGAVHLTRYGGAIAGVGIFVGMASIILPALTSGLSASVLARLVVVRGNSARTRSAIAASWKLASRLGPWSMPDVYLLGAVVAYTRLDRLVYVMIGAGGYALAALVFMQALMDQALGQQTVWHAIGNPARYAPAPGEPWILCLDCELVVATHRAGRRCPRCGARLVARRPGSIATTAAFTAAAFILYLPASVLPMLTITRFGSTQPYTIVGGVRDLAAAGLWPLALLVLFASIILPLSKLGALVWFLIAIRRRSPRLLRTRTVLYRLVDFIGRWSNIDVFMISIVAALLQFGTITTVDPGAGLVFFAAVVALTMIAARAFDPRLMWDAAGRARQ